MLYPIWEVREFAAGLDHPEGVAVGRDGTVYAGGEAGQVYRISPDGKKVEIVASTGGFCLGITLDQKEDIYVCDCGKRALFKVSQSGEVKVFADSAGDRKFVTPNFSVFDSGGYFTSAIPENGRKPMGSCIASINWETLAHSPRDRFTSPMGWLSMLTNATSISSRATWIG
jgi:gluconolactonase